MSTIKFEDHVPKKSVNGSHLQVIQQLDFIIWNSFNDTAEKNSCCLLSFIFKRTHSQKTRLEENSNLVVPPSSSLQTQRSIFNIRENDAGRLKSFGVFGLYFNSSIIRIRISIKFGLICCNICIPGIYIVYISMLFRYVLEA